MKRVAQILSWLALAVTLVPSLVFLAGRIELPQVNIWMLAGTIAWFITAPLWMEHKAKD